MSSEFSLDNIVNERIATQLSEEEALALFDAGFISYEQARDGDIPPSEQTVKTLMTSLQYWWL